MTAPTPPITASMLARYRASEIVGKVNGDRVTTWSDISGNGRDVTSATGPVYRPAGFGASPACEFAANAAEKMVSTTNYLTKPHTIYAAFWPDAVANEYWGSSLGFTNEVLWGIGVSATFRLVGSYDGTARGSITAEQNRTVQGVMADGSNVFNLWRTSRSGVLQPGNLVTSGAFSGAGPGSLRLGGRSAAGAEWDGMLAEVIVYSVAHDVTQVAVMVGWMADQYDIGPQAAQEYGGVVAARPSPPSSGRVWPWPV
jgi:hypothetical protein